MSKNNNDDIVHNKGIDRDMPEAPDTSGKTSLREQLQNINQEQDNDNEQSM